MYQRSCLVLEEESYDSYEHRQRAAARRQQNQTRRQQQIKHIGSNRSNTNRTTILNFTSACNKQIVHVSFPFFTLEK
jgi:hypothetical protein